MRIRGIEDLQQFDESFLDKKSRARIIEVLRRGGSAWIFTRSREEINSDPDLTEDEKMGCRISLGAKGVYRARMTDGGGFTGELPNAASPDAKDWTEWRYNSEPKYNRWVG